MADRIQLRRDTAANWVNHNPVLLEGEPGVELDTDQWKMGDGVHSWNDLPYRGGECVQQKGQSTTVPMSQKAVTDELNLITEFDGDYDISDRDSLTENGVYKCKSRQYIMFVKSFDSVVHQCEVGFNVSGDNYQFVYRIREYDGQAWSAWQNFDAGIVASITSLNQKSFDGFYNNTERDIVTSDGVYKCTNSQYIMFVRTVGTTIYQCEVGFNNMQYIYRIRKNEGDVWSAWVNYDDALNNAIENGTIVYTINLFDKSKTTEGYIGTGDGLVKTNPSYPNALVSPIIPVEAGETYYLQGRQSNAQGLVGYTANGAVVNITGGTHYQIDAANGSFTIPNNVVSVRFTVRLNTGDPAIVMLSKSTIAQTYQPYSIGVHEYLEQSAIGATVIKGNDVVTVYLPTQRFGIYIAFNIRHYVSQTDNVDYWRLADTFVCVKSNNLYTNLFQILFSNENEYVLKLKNGTDNTGGYHGDEILENIYFRADGKIYTISELPDELNCNEFEYLEKSSMYANAIGDNSIFATHFKQTIFKDAGYQTINRVLFAKDEVLACVYAGLACIHKNISAEYVAQDLVLNQTSGSDVQNTITSFVKGQAEVEYSNKNNAAGCVCSSRIISGIDETLLAVTVWDRQADTKYYHRTPENSTIQIANGDEISAECKVLFKV